MWFSSPPWDTITLWSLDLETSGLRPKSDAILSVGIVPVRSGVIAWGERYYSLVRPPQGQVLSEDGLAAHHILPSELADAPPLPHVLDDVLRRITDGVLLVHFASVDVAFLRVAAARVADGWPQVTVIDTARLLHKLDIQRMHLDPHAPPLPSSLPEARERLGLPPHENHHALADALATAELFLVLRARLGARTLRDLR